MGGLGHYPGRKKAGFPKRPVAKPGHEADLKKRTLTNLNNASPNWLSNAHQALDKAVATAYGWDDLHAGNDRCRNFATSVNAESGTQ